MTQPNHRHCQSKAAAASLLVTLIGVAVLGLLSANGCGRPHVRISKRDMEKTYRQEYMATGRNIGRWSSIWEKGSWIVALPPDTRDEPDTNEWRGLIIDGLTDIYRGDLSSQDLWQFRDTLANSMTLDFTNAPDPSGRARGLEPGDETEWFARVNLPGRTLPWTFAGDDLVSGPMAAMATEKLALAQLQALEDTDLFAWVEPNLYSEIQQDDTAQPGSRPPEWDLKNSADEPIPPAQNRIRQIFTRINWHKAQDYLDSIQKANPELQKAEIPVAVLDTGVDYVHPELVNRMYKNPLETADNGIDDDGNGVVDDAFGFDATVPKRKDPVAVGSPGASDIPGAGNPCPPRTPDGPSCGHGTHVAGIIAAQVGGLGSIGICDTCKIYSIRASQRCQYPDTARRGGACVRPRSGLPASPQAEGESYVANGKILDFDQIVGLNYILRFSDPETGKLRIFIVNMSLGKYIYNRTMASVLDKLEENGVLIVAAAGNDNTETPMFPAAYASTLSVCATSEDPGTLGSSAFLNGWDPANGNGMLPTRGKYGKTDFSNFGDWVDICAPGFRILSTVPGGRIAEMSGTSQASPLVAGAAGYIWSILIGRGQLDPTLVESNRSIRGRLQRYADPRGIYDPQLAVNRGYGDTIGGVTNYLLGSGMLDMYGALMTEEGGATASYVADDELSGRSNTLRSGCIVSTVGGNHARWTAAAALTTMPFVMMQFVAALWIIRWYRKHKRAAAASGAAAARFRLQ